MTFTNEFERLCKEKKLTLIKLSEITKISISELSCIKNGKRKPRVISLKKLADAFEVDYNYLYHLVY